MSRSSTPPLPPPPLPNPVTTNSRAAVRSQACERCWRRKQKCDKVFPACSSCAELGITCNARILDLSREGRGLSYHLVPDYVATLKRKVEQLENDSQEKRARLSSESHSQSPTSSCNHAPNTHQHQVQGSVSPPSNDASQGISNDGAVRATMGEIGLLSLSAMAEPRDQSAESARHLSLENMIRAAVAFEVGQSTHMPSCVGPSRIPAGIHTIIVSQPITIQRNTMIDYIGRYIQEIGLSFAYIVDANLMEDFEAVVANHQAGGDTEAVSQSPHRDFSVYMAIAIGVLLSPESNRLESVFCSLHAASMKLLPAILQASDDLITIKAMILLLIYSIFSPSGGSTWHLLGLAMKKCISVRLHKEVDVHMGVPKSEIAERRRLFWSLYVIDRSLASVIDRPFSIQDEDISVLFPEKYENNSTEKLGTSFSQYLVTHARLISDIRTKKSCTALSDYSNLCFWKETSSSFQKLGTSHEDVSRYIEQLCCRTMQQIFTPDSQAEVGRHSMIRSYYDIEKEVTSSCIRFITCLYDRSDYGYFAASLLDGYDIFSAGIIYLYISFRSQTGREQRLVQASNVVNMCSTLLTVIGERFPTIKSFRRILNAMSSISTDGFTSRDAKHNQWNTLQNLPICVPAQIRRIIQLFLNLSTTTPASDSNRTNFPSRD